MTTTETPPTYTPSKRCIDDLRQHLDTICDRCDTATDSAGYLAACMAARANAEIALRKLNELERCVR